MSPLKLVTLCIAIGGSGANAGRVVRVVEFVGSVACDPSLIEVYDIEPVSSRPVTVRHYPVTGPSYIVRGIFSPCYVARARLRPLLDPRIEEKETKDMFVSAS